MFKVHFDRKAGLVRMDGEGFYSRDDELRASVMVTNAIAECRAIYDDLKVLISCSSMVQNADVMETAAKRASLMTGSRDRVAFVCASSLQKLQASRYFKTNQSACFVSEEAAIMWLLADRGSGGVSRVAENVQLEQS